ncbi:hypothetical protein NIES4075_14870 [Tolypothrix sp. NIES-4075]|nr:tetratricopeptide repeat protein [Tolypothrix sp. NIES-4075]GAX40521.1 hypothetical protein NIES4075_14870 [Tolypothrix sp. NIES-4075]
MKYYYALPPVLYELKDLQGAVADYNSVLKINPNNAEAYKERQMAEGRRQKERSINKNFSSGYKAQFKQRIVSRRVERDTKRHSRASHVFKRGFISALCLRTSAF